MNKVGTKNFPFSTEFWWWTAKKIDFVNSNWVLNLIESDCACICVFVRLHMSFYIQKQNAIRVCKF